MEQKIYAVECYGTKVFAKGYTEKEGREKLARACINYNIQGKMHKKTACRHCNRACFGADAQLLRRRNYD